MNSSSFTFRSIEQSDRIWIDGFITNHWGSNIVVVHNKSYIPSQLNGYIACDGEENIGLVTYKIQNAECEIVTLNSLVENKGIGKRLVSLVEKEAKENNCKRVWLITTNDNMRAIGFYQKVGYQLINVFPNAVERSRILKPEIPLIANNGIPIRDELEFCLMLVT
jgi:N-acetylglutamate synthase-like GNAT family acetyltransferase